MSMIFVSLIYTYMSCVLTKGGLMHLLDAQFLLFPPCFQKTFYCRHVETRHCLETGEQPTESRCTVALCHAVNIRIA